VGKFQELTALNGSPATGAFHRGANQSLMAKMNAVEIAIIATGPDIESPDYPVTHPSLTVHEIDLWRATQPRIQPVKAARNKNELFSLKVET
jgi:hypothetical protein